jgi:hypothetical protein
MGEILMKNNYKTLFGIAFGTLIVLASTIMPAQAQAPIGNPLALKPPVGLPVVPIFEGAYENEDGSVSYSFGYLNRNTGEPITIPLGQNNRIEPAQFDGVQPTYFETTRHTGIFTVTVPASMRDGEVWWYIKTGDHEETKVPGRRGRMGYTLDKTPRPSGSLAPLVSYTEGGPTAQNPMGMTAQNALSVKAGVPVTLTVHTSDPSVRDLTDPRNEKPIPLRVSWHKHQGPGDVSFQQHATSADPEPLSELQVRRGRSLPGPEQTVLSAGQGIANVIATFSAPGDYVMRTMVDNWDANDSSEADQCCWTNVYQKVTVTP